MLWRASELTGYSIRATDGSLGQIDDFLFDDVAWTLRWAVIDTGKWLAGREVLLPPEVFDTPDAATREFPVALSRERIKDSPGIEEDAPVSRQMEADLYGYYGWSPYWGPGYAAPAYAPPAGVVPPAAPARSDQGGALQGEQKGDPDLRSISEVTGYYVRASDGDIGHVEEFLVEDGSWAVRYLVIDTKNWWPGKMVLVAPHWVRSVSWSEGQIAVDLTRDQIKGSPEYNPAVAVDRAYEERLYGYYGYPPYWV